MQTNAKRDRVVSQISALEAQGFLNHRGSALWAYLVFNGGKLTVNGQPYPPRTSCGRGYP
jgi:hypothetical protein